MVRVYYKYKSSSRECELERTSQIMIIDRCNIYIIWVLGEPDKVNMHCLMHDTRLSQIDVKMTYNHHETKYVNS